MTATNKASGIAVTTSNSGYWTLDNNGLTYSDEGSRYLATYNDGDFRYYTAPLISGQSMANVFYKYSPSGSAEEAIANITTRSSLSYNYTKLGDESFEYTSVTLRFGGIISKALWEDLDAESNILSYGVFLSTNTNDIEDYYNISLDGANGDVDDAIADLCGGDFVENYNSLAIAPTPKTTPTLFLAANYDSLSEDTYIWNLCVNATPASSESTTELTTEYTAVAYIRTSNGIVFFDEVTASAKSLASDLLPARGNGAYGGSLSHLANLA